MPAMELWGELLNNEDIERVQQAMIRLNEVFPLCYGLEKCQDSLIGWSSIYDFLKLWEMMPNGDVVNNRSRFKQLVRESW
jgi:hypothetical protein